MNPETYQNMTHKRPFDHLVFDLDDTILDTYRQLIPQAFREACQAMIASGLNADLKKCEEAREEHARIHSRLQLFEHLAQQFGVRDDTSLDATALAKRGYEAFHNRRVEPGITLFPGTREMLLELKRSYTLHLVTAGHRETQEAKIRILGIRPLFETIHHVDPTKGERKQDAFKTIMIESGASPSRHLSIGNRLDTDISEARALGWKTCWVRYGEYSNHSPSSDLENPDYEINGILELRNRCQL